MMDSFKLFPSAERRIIFCGRGRGRVVPALVRGVLAKPQLLFRHPEREIPFFSFFFPVVKPFRCLALIRLYIPLKFHLLKLARAERKIPRGNLVPEDRKRT